MPARRANPRLVKLNRSYTVEDLAQRLGVSKGTIRDWQRAGLEPIDQRRPRMFAGAAVREFLNRRNKARKCSCAPGTIFCFKCRKPRRPSRGKAAYHPIGPKSGNLRARCEHCGTAMFRGVAKTEIGRVLPGCDVQIAEALRRLNRKSDPTLNRDSEGER